MAQISRLRVIICSALGLSSIEKSFTWSITSLLLDNFLVIVTFIIQVFVHLSLVDYLFDLIVLFISKLSNLSIASILMILANRNLLSLLVVQE